MKVIYFITSIPLGALGFLLLVINIIGLTKNIEPNDIKQEDLRFNNDQTLSYQQAVHQLSTAKLEAPERYSMLVTNIIANRLAHIHWNRSQPTKFNQSIPIWENYILYLMAEFSDMPEYERYHFADYDRSLKRGIGICGDASMIMSQLLDINNIRNKIISFPGHVVIEAKITENKLHVYDPDFGVILPFSIENISTKPFLVREYYFLKGYKEEEISELIRSYSKPYKIWSGTSHFIRKKYYFEYISYWLKWLLPLIFIVIASFFIKKLKSK